MDDFNNLNMTCMQPVLWKNKNTPITVFAVINAPRRDFFSRGGGIY